MGIKQLYNANVRKLPNEYGDVSVMRCDFNSRCEDMVDFIEGVDCVGECNVLDFDVNKYDHLRIDFFLSSNMRMLNKRNFTCNDFTCITSNGRSVVDYCFTAHEDLSIF